MRKNILFLVAILSGVLLFNSCLKDDEFDNWKEDVKGSIFATVVKPQLQQLSLEPVPGEVEFEFLINIASDVPPNYDINVTMGIDSAAVAAYNQSTGKNYKVYPKIEILTPNVTIPKGTRVATVRCKVWGANELNACDNFIAPIGIVSVSNNIPIAANMKTYMLALPIKNPYAGFYHAVGYRLHPSLGLLPFDYPSLELKTVDCKTVKKDRTGDYTGYTLNIEVTEQTIVLPNGHTVYKVIATINEVDASDQGMYPDDAGQPMNYYDPVDNKFELYYFYNSSAPRKIRETLTRL